MTPKDRASKLILKFMALQEPNYNWFHKELSKQCALIAVDEILKIELLIESVDDYYLRYWQEVKQEIENI